MALNYSVLVYHPAFGIFARPVTFVGNAVPSSGRGIYNTESIDVLTEDGSIFSDARTVLDVLEDEYTVLPSQDDIVNIPAVADLPDLGDFVVIDTKSNGGGETTLTLRKVVVSKPV